MATSTANITTDTTNYTRIHLILMKGGTLLTKTLFLKRVKDLSTAGQELTVDEFLGKHRVQILSTSTGRNNEDKLYPPTGTNTNLDEWDLPLYCFILKTVCDLPVINKLDMGFLKTMRNDLSHLHDPSLNDADFKNHLSIIEPIFSRSLQIINDPLFEADIKTLLQRCETGALAVDEVVKVYHDSSRKHIELLSNQVKMMKNQGVMLQNQTSQNEKIDSALSMLTEINDKLPPNSNVDIPDVHVIIEVKNCTKEKEKELLDFLVKQFNETISKPECSLNKDFPNLAMHKVSEAICKTFQNFIEKGRHIIKVENKCISLTIQCSSISSFVGLVRDCMDGKLLDLLSDLKNAMQSWEGCTHLDIDPVVTPDEITEAILILAKNLDDKFPKRVEDDEPPQNSSSTNFDVSTVKEDKSASCSTPSVLRLIIKPENVDLRKEIEECFNSGKVSDIFKQFQQELREDPNFTNVKIEATLLASDMHLTGLMKTQQSLASIPFGSPEKQQNPQDTQGSDTKQHVLEWIESLPEHQIPYETDDLIESSNLYFKEERVFDKPQRTIQNKQQKHEGETQVPIEKLSFGLNEDDFATMDCENFAMEQINQKFDERDSSTKPHSSSGVETGDSNLSSCDSMQEQPDKFSELSSEEKIDEVNIKGGLVTPVSPFATQTSETTRHEVEWHYKLSLLLSVVLDDIGVSEQIILKRRRAFLMSETLQNIRYGLQKTNMTVFHFGSQSEGTTTLGLNSDIDVLVCHNEWPVIHDCSEWRQGIMNLLIVTDELTSPDYCLLQAISPYEAYPITYSDSDYLQKDLRGRILLKNTLFKSKFRGPSYVGYLGEDLDYDCAFLCATLPKNAEFWLQQQVKQETVTLNMAKYIRQGGCLIVPERTSDSDFQIIEWRMSFSHAERCLMFSLNEAQIRCYVLMKMILKTYLKPMHTDHKGISSYICKHVFLQFVLKDNDIKWENHRLIQCLRSCLFWLEQCIEQDFCPHFILRNVNLIKDRLLVDEKHILLEKMRYLLQANDTGLFAIKIDNLGKRLLQSFGRIDRLRQPKTRIVPQPTLISGHLIFEQACLVSKMHHSLLLSSAHCLDQAVEYLPGKFTQGSKMEQVACRLIVPLICSSIGCQKASFNMEQGHPITKKSLHWNTFGGTSDAASGLLKLASVYYGIGYFGKVEIILSETLDRLKENVVIDVCVCHPKTFKKLPNHFSKYAHIHGEYALQKTIAFCVKFLPQEYNCVPKELKYEMFRSTRNDLTKRTKSDLWMDWAVVDSLPYLFFLQYKTYGYLQRTNNKWQALRNLMVTLKNDHTLGHLETGMNLLGQCFLQEKREIDAFHCFYFSLKIRPRNNVANWHVCRLLESKFSASH